MAELGRTPSHSWLAGTPRKTPKGTPLNGVHPHTYLNFLLAEGTDGELTVTLEKLLVQLAAHRDFLLGFRAEGGTTLFYVYWYPNADTGAVFGAGLLRSMADLGFDFGLNVYDDRTRLTEA